MICERCLAESAKGNSEFATFAVLGQFMAILCFPCAARIGMAVDRSVEHDHFISMTAKRRHMELAAMVGKAPSMDDVQSVEHQLDEARKAVRRAARQLIDGNRP